DESPTEAERWLRQAVAERPPEHEALYSLFQCLQRMGKQNEAAEIQATLKAIESDLMQLRETIRQIATTPHDPEPRCKAGVILLRNGKDKEGLASERFEQIDHALAEEAEADPALYGFGTTMTIAANIVKDLFVAHIGDSRAYLFRGGKLHQL